MAKKEMHAFTGAEAAAYAMKQINPDVVAAYPITPQTPIVMNFANYVADGVVDTEVIHVESEHSAMSAVVGAAAAGARAMTATSANGLALMWEIIYIAASTRLPIVMSVANRALSAPINIHCDHSDAMGMRDAGWIQLFAENAQEVYDLTVLAPKIAENKDVLLPVAVNQDGFIISHGVENVEVLDDNSIKNFVGEYVPHINLLDVDKPITIGPLDLWDYYFEHKRQQVDAMENARTVIKDVFSEYEKLSGRKYDHIEKYYTDDAEVIAVVLGSTAGNAKQVINWLRDKGKKVGLVKITTFRPFPYKEIADALKNAKVVAVMDRAISFGAFGPVYDEVRSALYSLEKRPAVVNYVYGLGGREILLDQIKDMFESLLSEKLDLQKTLRFIGVRE